MSRKETRDERVFIADVMLSRLTSGTSEWCARYILRHPSRPTIQLSPLFYSSVLARVQVMIDGKWACELVGFADESVLFLARNAREWDTFESIQETVNWLEGRKANREIDSFSFRFVGDVVSATMMA